MKVKLNDVRISFCHSIFEAEQYQNAGAFRHSASFLIVPGSENDKKVQAAIKAEAVAKFGKRADAMLESMRGNTNKFCYTKGELKDYEGYAGMLVLSSHRKQEQGRPLVIDQHKNPLVAKDGKPYAGCYVNATVEIYAQEGQNSGIRCGLSGIQFWRDGDAFSAGGSASVDEFDALEGGASSEFDAPSGSGSLV